ncbi:MAG: 6,7-dimethyl-8-ribityllumazine synthase [Actinomycetota bacterium]
MAAPTSKAVADTELDGSGLTVAVVTARWNAGICAALREGARRAIARAGADVVDASAPGAFELPFAAKVLAERDDVDAVVVIGCVIRGETTHYELVSEGCATGVMSVQLETGVPIGLGVATVESPDQALARAQGPGGHNVGEDAAAAAIEMALLARTRGCRGDAASPNVPRTS